MRLDLQAYREYLNSPEWQGRRTACLERDGGRCRECGDDGTLAPLEAHHLTYERVGHELLSDLVTLCRPCHAHAHGRSPIAGGVAGAERERERVELSRRQWEVLEAAKRAARPLEDRIRELGERARSGNREAHRTLFVIRQTVERAERKLSREAERGSG